MTQRDERPQIEAAELRTVAGLLNFTVRAEDGELGVVQDVVATLPDWTLRYLLLNAETWLPDKCVVVPLAWIDHVDWEQQRIDVAVTCAQVRAGPHIQSTRELNREFERRFYAHFQRPGYWIRESEVDEASWESFPASDPPAKW